MTSSTLLQNVEKHLPLVGDIHSKSAIAYGETRLAVSSVKCSPNGSGRVLYQRFRSSRFGFAIAV